MKITVDGTKCTGHGRCYTLAPDVLFYDDEGFVTIRDVEFDVPPGREALIADVILACPEAAIHEISES